MGKYYAVKKGRMPGIYTSWEECKKNTQGYPGTEFKSFKTAAEAAEYMGYAYSATAVLTEKNTYNIEDDKHIIAYVDGSYNIATNEYGYGAVIISKAGEIELYGTGDNKELALMRNVAGEIKGAEAAMRYGAEKGYAGVTIYHDYEGVAKWCTGEWKANKEGTKEYKRIYDEYSKIIDIKFVKVKGHSGDKYNDMADNLAKRAAGVI